MESIRLLPRTTTLLAALASLPLADRADAGLVIVDEGRPRAVIVVASNATATARRAAEELQRFVGLMSGATLPIQPDSAPLPPDAPRLLVGRSAFTSGLQLPAGDDRDRTREGFVLRTQSNALLLAGNEDGEYHGTEYAVYELLERLGCRWFFPGEYGQVVPALKTIEVPDLNVSQKPSFVVRNIWASGWADRTPGLEEWLLRNKGTPRGGFAFPGDGTIHQLVPRARYATNYPDIYAMGKDGRRQDDRTPAQDVMLCTTHPKAVELAAASIVENLRAHPEANSYGFSAPDNAALCYCSNCVARMHGFYQDSGIGESISDPYFNFVNNLAWEVNRQLPDKYIVTLAYASRVVPPEGLDRPWNTNIIVQLAQLRISAFRPIGATNDFSALRQLRTLSAWSRVSPKMLVYDYDPHADLSRMPFWRSRSIASDMRLYKRHGVIGFTTEGNNTFFRTGLNYYMRARCMWDVDSDPDAVLDDFYRSFFGPAAAPMKEFCEAIESMLLESPDHLTWQPIAVDWTPTYPPERVAALGPLLDRAEGLAGTPDLKKRIQLYRILHGYMTTYLRICALERDGRYREALAELDRLTPLIDAAQAIQPGLLPPDPKWVLAESSGIAYLTTRLTALARCVDSPSGELLGRASGTGQFLKDPGNIGLFEQWQREDVASRLSWDPIDLTRSWGLLGYRDTQGYAYDGIGWYRVRMRISKPGSGRAQLVAPLLFAEKAWVWVNGQLVCSPSSLTSDLKIGPTPGRALWVNVRGYVAMAVDIHDQIRPNAENTVTFRLQGSTDRAQHHGIASVPFVWAPRQSTESP